MTASQGLGRCWFLNRGMWVAGVFSRLCVSLLHINLAPHFLTVFVGSGQHFLA